jgi:uncharacterized protein (DUF433 family)
MASRILDPQDVISRYQAGQTPAAIIAAYNYSVTTEAVRRLLRRHGVRLRSRGGPNFYKRTHQ